MKILCSLREVQTVLKFETHLGSLGHTCKGAVRVLCPEQWLSIGPGVDRRG